VILCSKTSELGLRDIILRCCARGSVIKDQPVERVAAKIDGLARKLSTVFPAAEPQRLAAVRSYAILETPPEEDFDDLTRRASHS
jgi:hypothetical protein